MFNEIAMPLEECWADTHVCIDIIEEEEEGVSQTSPKSDEEFSDNH